MQIIFLDTETTNIDQSALLVQLAYKNPANGRVVNEYFKPPAPISFGAMAVHHITNEMVADKPAFVGSEHHAALAQHVQTHIIVAHNAPFDIGVLQREGIEVQEFLDTLRIARHVVESDQYKLQYLRYFLNLGVTADAHDALGDILVLEALFNHLKKVVAEKFALGTDEEVLAKMLELTNAPVLLNSIGFGKYKGKTFAEVSGIDRGYLEWLRGSESQKNPAEQNQELLYTLNHYCN